MSAEESILKHLGLAGVLKGYGIYENVITAMEDYADEFRQAAVSGSVCSEHQCEKVCPQCENDTFPM